MVRRGVICGGSIVVDVNKLIDRLPPPEQVAIIQSETPDSGGPGFNMAVNLRRLGADFPVELVGVVGDDAHGRLALAVCREHGIGSDGVGVVQGVPTSYTDVMIEQGSGRRTFFHQQGANALLSSAAFDFTSARAKTFHVGAPGVHPRMDRATAQGNGFSEVLARAKAAGLRTNMELVGVEPARIRELALPCLPHLDTIIINEEEAAAVTGIDAAEGGAAAPARVDAAARALLRLGVGELVVVHYPAGCVAVSASGEAWRQGAVRVPAADIRSTNGAGDALASGVMLGLHEGWAVDSCLRLGVCVAAVSLLSYSTSRGVLPVRECLADGENAGFLPA